ncbi:hypothetical protein ASD21_07590 [Caulobacter sp. Root1455]|uniref:hypothetical protein n=1 Tax=unclassified Caulobacter TaxID=2648921 RepID=UPI0006FF51AB|nr:MULTISPECIES: hypothetical protein [unclassified Caulobacter]KQY30926.1 hypothetical protein ASD38_06070 [Caulobacter sp. Root487D2Y]KQY95218.1 hypothetical protein ASD21_07590 [Caulobacter sp. Root1455]
MRPILIGIGAVLALSASPLAAAAGEAPVKTVAKLDAKDPKYDTEACKAIRAKAIDYEKSGLVSKALSMGGNAVVPFAGTVASAALGMQQGAKEEKLSKQVALACVSDPLNEETPLINAPKAPEPASVVVIAAPPADVTTAAATDAAATEKLATAR